MYNVCDDIYTKYAEESEYNMHKIAYDAGINVPRIVAWNREQTEMTTEFLRGVDVIEYLRKNHGVDRTVTVCKSLVKQVQKLHSLGYTHGDLNPTNIIITPNSEVFLLDFEFAGSGIVSVDEELMELVKLLTILLSSFPARVFSLLSLCEATESSRLPFALRGGMTYDDIQDNV